jgi:hypothetical protein
MMDLRTIKMEIIYNKFLLLYMFDENHVINLL